MRWFLEMWRWVKAKSKRQSTDLVQLDPRVSGPLGFGVGLAVTTRLATSELTWPLIALGYLVSAGLIGVAAINYRRLRRSATEQGVLDEAEPPSEATAPAPRVLSAGEARVLSAHIATAITRFLEDCDEEKPRGAALSPRSTGLDWEDARNQLSDARARHSDRTVKRFEAKFGEDVRQAYDALAVHGLAGDLDRFRLEHPANIADLQGIVEQLGAAAWQWSGSPAALREHIASGRSVDTSERLDPQTGLPPVFDNDPLYEWALGAWRLLREYRYDEPARGFKGAGEDASFERAFHRGTSELGREGYRNRCVRILEDCLAELEGRRPEPEPRAFDPISGGGPTAARLHARHVIGELSRSRKTVERALEQGRWWDVGTTGLQSTEWRAARDLLAEHAPTLYDKVDRVYALVDQLNIAANEDNATFGPADQLSTDEARLDLDTFASEAHMAIIALRGYYEGYTT